MKKSAKRVLGGLALGAAAAGAIGALIMKRDGKPKRGRRRQTAEPNRWARPGMRVVFRAELMPGRDASERTFQVTNLLPSGRVLLEGVSGEHTETEFQPHR